MAVLQALVAAGLGVAAVLQRPPLLLEAHHLVLAYAAQVSVELPDRQAHKLLVGEALVDAALPVEKWKEPVLYRGAQNKVGLASNSPFLLTLAILIESYIDVKIN